MCSKCKYIVVVFLPLLVSCLEEMVLNSETLKANHSLLSTDNTNKTPDEKTPPLFGILNTLEDYSKWAAKEVDIISVLGKRLSLIETEMDLIDNYLVDYQESTAEAMMHLKEPKNTPEERGRVVGSSAVLGHRMITRYVGVVSDMRKMLNSSVYQDNLLDMAQIIELEETTKPTHSSSWPGRIERFMSMESLIHIQEIYGYLPDQVYQGFNFENKSDIKMSTIQCAEMGMFALYNNHYYLSVEWLQFTSSHTKSDVDISGSNVPADLTEYLLMTSIQEHNRILNKSEFANDVDLQLNLYTSPIPQQRIAKRKALFLRMRGLAGNNTEPEAQFMDLCRGNISQTPVMQRNLKCFYEKSRHPYLYINPVMVEHLSESPPIYQYYEIITEEATQHFHWNMSGKLEPSLVYGDRSSMESVTKFRTSVGFGIPQEVTPEKVFRLADMVTDLNVWDGGDRIQYVEYTYGRFFVYHTDALADYKEAQANVDLEAQGERLATILYYLEIPAEGGLTPFCEAGVSARPVRRSAVFWFNLHRNGTSRPDVHHGACPVIHGHKIIMNHWIRHRSNWQRYKCSLNRNE